MSKPKKTPGSDEFEALREALLVATLPHVAFEGWTHGALRAGAAAAGLEAGDVQRAFPGGPIEAIDAFNRLADRKMVEALQAIDLDAIRTRDRIAAALRARLEWATPHKEAVRRALTLLALPFNAPRALGMLHRTVDAAWHAAGDRSTDYNWYTKRGLLAGVYSATVLYWLGDKSEGHADTWTFLDRRIDNVMRIGGAIGRATKALGELRNPFWPPRGPGGRGPYGRGSDEPRGPDPDPPPRQR